MPSWRFVQIDELEPPEPPSDPDFTEEERERARAELRRRPPEQEARNAEVASKFPSYGKRWRQIRRVFGITSFGVAANEADSGEPLIIPHDESEHGQEELYVVMRGRARFECAGETMEGGPGAMLYVPPGTLRAVVALEDRTLLLMLGGRPGSYEPPIWARDWRPPREWLEQRRT